MNSTRLSPNKSRTETQKTHHPKNRATSPVLASASLAGAKPSLIFTELDGAAGGGEDAGTSLEPLKLKCGGFSVAAFRLCSAFP